MSSERHRRAQEVFEVVCDLPATEQARVLREECAGDTVLMDRVSALLEQDRVAQGALEQPAASVLGEPEDPEAIPFSDAIPGYRLLSRLGVGGMGVVYEAEQEKPHRRVALKVLRADFVSAEFLRRFEIEAEALARLNHPGIAHILEVGTAELGGGRQPFFALELVQGDPIVDFVRRRKMGTRGCIELLAKVADAVHHAHQKGVIHRDLKPANILVEDSGQPKVLDFGVARVADSDSAQTGLQTRTGELIGTLSYMSPEQLAGDPGSIDTRSDVYALGVLLYEVLAGTRPFDVQGLSLPSAMQRIAQEDPTRLSLLRPTLRGDVEVIVEKAMSKETRQRYGSAEEFAADLRRFLADEPIAARPPSTRYRIEKFMRRNKGLVSGAAIIAITLVLATIVSRVEAANAKLARTEAQDALFDELAARAEAEKARAQAESATEEMRLALQDSDAVVDFFSETFAQASPFEARAENRGRDPTVLEVLESSQDEIETRFRGRPRVAARLHQVMGAMFLVLQRPDRARARLARAAEVFEAELGPEAEATLHSKQSLARNLAALGQWSQADELFNEVIEVGSRSLGPDDPLVLKARGAQLTFLRFPSGDMAGYEEDCRDLLPRLERVLGNAHLMTVGIRVDLAVAHINKGQSEQALELLHEAIAAVEDNLGFDHPGLATALHYAGTSYANLERFDEALEALNRSLALNETYFGPDGPEARMNRQLMLAVEREAGRPQEALLQAEEFLAREASSGQKADGITVAVMQTLGTMHADDDRHEDAVAVFEAACEVARQEWPQGHFLEAEVLLHLGISQLALDLVEEARTSLRAAHEIMERPGSPTLHKAELEIVLQEAEARADG